MRDLYGVLWQPGLSPVKTYLIAINSATENEFSPEKELHFHPKASVISLGRKITPQLRKSAASTTVNSGKFFFYFFLTVSIQSDTKQCIQGAH